MGHCLLSIVSAVIGQVHGIQAIKAASSGAAFLGVHVVHYCNLRANEQGQASATPVIFSWHDTCSG